MRFGNIVNRQAFAHGFFGYQQCMLRSQLFTLLGAKRDIGKNGNSIRPDIHQSASDIDEFHQA